MFTYWRGLYPLGYITECSKNLIFSGQWLMTHKPWRNKGNNIKRKVEFLKLDVIANKTDLCCQRVMIWHENCVGGIHICTDLIWVCKYRLHAEKPFLQIFPRIANQSSECPPPTASRAPKAEPIPSARRLTTYKSSSCCFSALCWCETPEQNKGLASGLNSASIETLSCYVFNDSKGDF